MKVFTVGERPTMEEAHSSILIDYVSSYNLTVRNGEFQLLSFSHDDGRWQPAR